MGVSIRFCQIKAITAKNIDVGPPLLPSLWEPRDRVSDFQGSFNRKAEGLVWVRGGGGGEGIGMGKGRR